LRKQNQLKAHPEKVDPGIGRMAIKQAKDRQSSWTQYIVLHFRHTGNLVPGCDARDWYAWYDINPKE